MLCYHVEAAAALRGRRRGGRRIVAHSGTREEGAHQCLHFLQARLQTPAAAFKRPPCRRRRCATLKRRHLATAAAEVLLTSEEATTYMRSAAIF